MKPKLLFLQTEDSTFWSHRLPFARAALAAGYEVVVAARVESHGESIRGEGLRLIHLPWRRSGVDPLYEARLLWRVIRLYREERPALVHQVTAKPILYGTLAARLSGVRGVVNTFTGLGFVFISSSPKARLLRWAVSAAMRLALGGRNVRTIFQNADDRSVFVDAGLTPRENAVLIRGSGVDVVRFHPLPDPEGTPLVVLPGRMLWDKGVGEFVEAARLLRDQGVRARFALVGERDPENPSAVPAALLEQWRQSGVVEWWGRQDDMLAVYAQAAVVCLPSYREGLPKALLEASACARAIVATDVPGCREVVRHEDTGLLVCVRDAWALASALRRLLADGALRRRFGERARRSAVDEFAQEKVVEQTLQVYGGLLALNGTSRGTT